MLMMMMMMLDYVNLLVEFVIMSMSILFPTRIITIITTLSFQAVAYLLVVVVVTNIYIYIYIGTICLSCCQCYYVLLFPCCTQYRICHVGCILMCTVREEDENNIISSGGIFC